MSHPSDSDAYDLPPAVVASGLAHPPDQGVTDTKFFDLPEPELRLDLLGAVESITSTPRLFAMRTTSAASSPLPLGLSSLARRSWSASPSPIRTAWADTRSSGVTTMCFKSSRVAKSTPSPAAISDSCA